MMLFVFEDIVKLDDRSVQLLLKEVDQMRRTQEGAKLEVWDRTCEKAYSLLTGHPTRPQSLWADPFVSLTLAAELTTTPRLAITVSNPMTRHPAVVASSSLAIRAKTCNSATSSTA